MTVETDVWERIEARRAKWKTYEAELLPGPDTLQEYCICGSFSLTAMQTRRRFLYKRVLVPTPAGNETPSHIARDYLTVTYKRGPLATHNQMLTIRAGLHAAPLYSHPKVFRNGWYLDLKSAYWSIMQIVGWNPDYWPGRWLSPGRPPSDFPWPDHKLARNCLVTAGEGGRCTVWWPDSGYGEKEFGNVLANLQLKAVIMDVLNSIAAEIVKIGAVYVATDGYILPSLDIMQQAVKVIDSWRLKSSVKGHGAGVVRGPGAYSVGAHVSRREVTAPIEHSSIYAPKYAGWLKERFVWAAEGRMA